MTPNERERIEKEAEELSKTDWAATDKDRRFIKGAYIAGATAEHNLLKPQLEYADNTIKKLHEAMVSAERRGHDKAMEEMKARDESATTEHDKARNQAIDECILIAFKDDGSHWIELRNKLEQLKTKP